MPYKFGKLTSNLLERFYFYFTLIFFILEGSLTKKNYSICACWWYEMIIANSAIYHLISDARSCNNC